MEQDRASPVLAHHHELAGPSSRELPSHCQSHRGDNNSSMVTSTGRPRHRRLSHQGESPGLTHHFSQRFQGSEPVQSTSTRFSTPPGGGDGGCSFLYFFSRP